MNACLRPHQHRGARRDRGPVPLALATGRPTGAFGADGRPIYLEIQRIRQAIGLVACEITSSRVVFVDPPYPPEEPREGKSKFSMMVGASGKSFLASPKIHQKICRNKKRDKNRSPSRRSSIRTGFVSAGGGW